MNDDWFDELLDGKPSGITDTQWFIIESNIDSTSLPLSWKDDILSSLDDLTQIEAEKIIQTINENKIERDTRKQWLKMLKDGVFGNRNI